MKLTIPMNEHFLSTGSIWPGEKGREGRKRGEGWRVVRRREVNGVRRREIKGEEKEGGIEGVEKEGG